VAPPSGFLESLFDFSFTTFITTKLIKVLYGLWVTVAGLFALALFIDGFRASTGVEGVALFIGAPLVFLLSVIYGRILLELIIVVFRIAEHTAEIAEQGRRLPAAAGRPAGEVSEVRV